MPRSLLVINSYVGSLLVAAARTKHPVLISLEDHGYGALSQRLNFPDIPVIDEKPWPEPGASLKNVIGIAHPPCACFSVQGANQDPAKRGLSSEHFKSTVAAVEYALELGVAALAVESVVPTMKGAWEFHEKVARRHEYNVFRILQNAITYGIPQWRPRFWCIFIKRVGAVSQQFAVHHQPYYKTVGEVLEGVPPGEPVHYVDKGFKIYQAKLEAKGLNIDRVLEEGFGSLPTLVGKHLKLNGASRGQIQYNAAKYCNFTTFSSSWPLQLDPGGFAPTLMATSHWWYQGRPLTKPEYLALAGFPTDYQIEKPRDITAYLSRGVAPPVAQWILGEVERNLDGELPVQQAYTDLVAILKPDDVADFRVKRSDLRQKKLFNLHRGEE